MKVKSTLNSFLLAMILYPDVQQKAQEEIDREIGDSRLPAFSDLGRIPYVDAIVNECLRWRPVLNLGTHTSSVNGSVLLTVGIPRYPSSS